jgi:hypothetical protein
MRTKVFSAGRNPFERLRPKRRRIEVRRETGRELTDATRTADQLFPKALDRFRSEFSESTLTADGAFGRKIGRKARSRRDPRAVCQAEEDGRSRLAGMVLSVFLPPRLFGFGL